jgi:tetratricopeptide (TPR) repeat protein
MALLCGLLCTSAATAGVYATADMPPGPIADETGVQPMPLDLYRSTLGDRIGLLRDPALLQPGDQPLPESTVKRRKEQEAKVAALQAKLKTGMATLDDQINLSAGLIALGKNQEAIDLLEPVARGEGRGHFMVLSNLATAYQLAGQMERVPDYLQLARSSWPDKVPGIKDPQLQFYRQVDRAQLRVVLLRKAEAAKQPPGVRRPVEGVDALFGEPDNPVRFIGESGQYEAGKIAAKEKEKLPKDALAIVQQLVLWFPEDTRLYWLLGELLNADGQINEAYTVLNECVDARRYDSAELKEHRRILLDALRRPRPEETAWLPGMEKVIVVGGGALLVLVLLGYFQFREFRRRTTGDGK